MLAMLRHLLRFLFGSNHEQPDSPKHLQAPSPTDDHPLYQDQRPDDRPTWAERVKRRTGSEDSTPERLRSLAAEQKAQHHENKGRGRTR